MEAYENAEKDCEIASVSLKGRLRTVYVWEERELGRREIRELRSLYHHFVRQEKQ